ncbi:hypothetical protein FSP39_001227 [Pinctada imbricata]|uniref:Uncharacterized protein n=1 Tax=Pinctada imbricata TaxID=66713 RepID=A0AA88XKF2_PINIB|nr:hypothetical protein FSP39_001227 [Pinctada imbricata]
MADTSDGHVLVAPYNRVEEGGNNGDNGTNLGGNDAFCVSTSGNAVAEALNCAYNLQNEEFVDLFTLTQSSTVSTANELDIEHEQTLPSQCSQNTVNARQNTILQQSDIAKLDSELCNIPRELYLHKLLQSSMNNESALFWYRNVLCSRAKSMEGCPQGNLINRKSTKKSTSAEKIARDCYIINSFICGDKSGIDEVFDKSKVNETPRVSQVELRVLTQSLLERVTSLEKARKEDEKVICDLRKEISSLKTQIKSMDENHEKNRNDTESRLVHQESFKKLMSDRVKDIEGLDHASYEQWVQKTEIELKRLSQVCLNNQRRITELGIKKSYSSIVASPSQVVNTATTIDHDGSELNNMSVSRIDDRERSPLVNSSGTRTSEPSLVSLNTMGNPTLSTLASSTPKRNVTVNRTADESKPRGGIRENPENIFIGVRRFRNARYYLSGIDPKSTKQGIHNYIESKGAKISHLILFKPRSSFARMTAKVNVRPEDADLLDDDDFWPPGVRCRRWLNARAWEERCMRRNEDAYEDWGEIDDDD